MALSKLDMIAGEVTNKFVNNVQKKIIAMILRKEPQLHVLNIVKDAVKRIENHSLNIKNITIETKLLKNLDEYKESLIPRELMDWKKNWGNTVDYHARLWRRFKMPPVSIKDTQVQLKSWF